MLQKYQHCLVSLIMAGGVVFCWLGYMYSTSLSPNEGPSKYDEELTWHPVVLSDRSQRKQAMLMEPVRTDVLTVTPWLAPIVWEGTFDPQVIDEAFRSYNLTIATTVFAVGKYTRFLHALLESAEKHFMTAIEEYIHQRANYIFCLDVDMIFHGRVGPEALGKLVAAIHPWFYWVPRSQYPYERRTISKAYIPQDHGDFYYQANIFGGAVEDVHRLTKTCREHLEMDKSAGVEAVWQEESHLNWYLWKNKPTKLLSPEYVWDDLRGQGAKEIKLVRFSSVIKNKAEVRENP
ncbi:globoside alpha-1,3-N-acetylgalactosaminyltransferase 1-like isoform X4 [Esox lucius]|uniref:globoside alpha-1,3-N-acetylgalactosaminyltransferase 1-like isoform X4 n=1 Tax=Esox lucius TaxID=8010 RepID=UPI0014772737|nr:globoside alpha-1,3-N-acetylgalactosaminyltransferase 1-like isoform X4 [Esox lucius]